jgi:hypothetical protein
VAVVGYSTWTSKAEGLSTNFFIIPITVCSTKLDEMWLELLMSIIGEQFENHGSVPLEFCSLIPFLKFQYICGAAVNLRQKGDKVTIEYN